MKLQYYTEWYNIIIIILSRYGRKPTMIVAAIIGGVAYIAIAFIPFTSNGRLNV